MIEAPPSLYGEIIEVYSANREVTVDVLLATLNGPARVQQRGFQVTAQHLLAVIVDNWRVNDKSRFAIYDFDTHEMLHTQAFIDPELAADAAVEFDNGMVVRFQI